MKSMSKKTLHRLTRHQGIKSDRRKGNALNAKWLLDHKDITLKTHRFKKKNKLTPKQMGFKSHINPISTKVNLSISNLNVVKEHGYMSRITKCKKEIVERQYDGYNCKERRLIARSLAKAYKLAAL